MLAYFLSGILLSYAEVVDKIVVIVNDEVITEGEVDRILAPIYMQYKKQYADEELAIKLDEGRRNVLQKLIQNKLLLSEAKRREIKVEDGELKKRVEEVKKRFPSEEGFQRALAEENITLSEFEKRHKERIMMDKLIEMEIRGRISVSPSEAMDYYESHKNQFEEPKKVKLKSILVKITKERPEEEALKLAKEILARLEEGASFGLLAEKYSDGPYAESGGEMGWVKEGDLMNEVNELVFALKENEVSGILKTSMGFHIFMVEEKMPSRAKDFNEARAEVEQILFDEKIEKHLGQWIEKLKKDAYIAFR